MSSSLTYHLFNFLNVAFSIIGVSGSQEIIPDGHQLREMLVSFEVVEVVITRCVDHQLRKSGFDPVDGITSMQVQVQNCDGEQHTSMKRPVELDHVSLR
jgi:hypothetical protein